jgi:hypothetical protein
MPIGTSVLRRSGLNQRKAIFSAAIHELCHIFGFGTASSWATQLSGTQFVGGNSKAKYDLGGNIPTDSIRVHWAEGRWIAAEKRSWTQRSAKGFAKHSPVST